MWRRYSKTMVSGLDAQQSELIFRVHTCLSLADAHWLWQENHSDDQFSRKPRETFPNWYLTNRKKRNTAYLHRFFSHSERKSIWPKELPWLGSHTSQRNTHKKMQVLHSERILDPCHQNKASVWLQDVQNYHFWMLKLCICVS